MKRSFTLRPLALLLGLLTLPGLGPAVRSASDLPTPKVLRDDTGLYPRVIRLSHSGGANGRLLASVAVPPEGDQPGLGAIYESRDGGRSFSATPVGSVRDPQAAQGLCCTTLFELPARMGDNPAGTLLWAASVGQNAPERRMSLPVWKSLDQGRHWSQLSSCAAAHSSGGLWEPAFSVAANGALVCTYSDETDQPRHSQTLMETVSTDGGAHWGAPRPVVAAHDPALRPGMATVVRLPGGSYLMTYEVCGLQGADCAAHLRFSRDGLDWGDPARLGQRIFASTGRFFAHTPLVAWAPGGGPQGSLLLVGQLLMTPGDLAPSGGTGRTLMLNTTGGVGNWIEVPAPFALENVYDDYCPNYSSPLLPSPDGEHVLELATNYDQPLCKPFYGTGSIARRYRVDHGTRGGGLGQLDYSGTWKADATRHFSAGAAGVTLRFAGSGVQVYGSGAASAQLDGRPLAPLTGETPFTADRLSPGLHTLTLQVQPDARFTLTHVGVDLGH